MPKFTQILLYWCHHELERQLLHVSSLMSLTPWELF